MSNKNFEDKVLKALGNIEKDVSGLKQDIARLDLKIDKNYKSEDKIAIQNFLKNGYEKNGDIDDPINREYKEKMSEEDIEEVRNFYKNQKNISDIRANLNKMIEKQDEELKILEKNIN